MPVSVFLLTICIFVFILNILYYKSTKHPWKNGILGTISGPVFLIPCFLILQSLGFSVWINYSSLLFSAVFGIPGVLMCAVYTICF
jgi:hypothetical protein